MATKTRVPTSDGDCCWHCSEGTSRYALINEYPAVDDTKYTYNGDSNGSDNFLFTAFDVPVGAIIQYVRVYVRCQVGYNSPIDFGVFIFSTYSNGYSIAIGESFEEHYAEWTTNPWTNEPWTVAEVNGVGSGDNILKRIGYTKDYINEDDYWVSRLYIEVAYNVPTGAQAFII